MFCAFSSLSRAILRFSSNSSFSFLLASMVVLTCVANFLRSFSFFLCHSVNSYLCVFRCCMHSLCSIRFLRSLSLFIWPDF